MFDIFIKLFFLLSVILKSSITINYATIIKICYRRDEISISYLKNTLKSLEFRNMTTRHLSKCVNQISKQMCPELQVSIACRYFSILLSKILCWANNSWAFREDFLTTVYFQLTASSLIKSRPAIVRVHVSHTYYIALMNFENGYLYTRAVKLIFFGWISNFGGEPEKIIWTRCTHSFSRFSH